MAFTAEMVDNFKEAFACFDVRGESVASAKDLGRVMNAFGLEPTVEELNNMIAEVDGSGKNAVDFAEFMKMMARNGTSTAAEIKESFSLFNKSGSGAITAGELRAVLDALGEKYKPEDVDAMIKVADKSGRGGVGFEDFQAIMLE